MDVLPYNPTFVPEIYLPFEDEKDKVSPSKKKKVRRPIGSKHKKKMVDVNPQKLGWL